jgi:type II secretory pathway component PulF
MADKSASDPLALWRGMVSQWEKNVNELANKNMATDQFSGSMNQMLNAMLQGQQSMGEVMARYLASLNLPSRSDLLSLGEQLGAIETQLSHIAQLLERQNGSQVATSVKTPPRTKRPPPADS